MTSGLGTTKPIEPADVLAFWRTAGPDKWFEKDALFGLGDIATHVVGDRPDRFEPRRKKRRPKPHKYLLEPRQHYKRQVA